MKKLRVLALNCTLQPDGKASSTERLLSQVLKAFAAHDCTNELVHVASLNIKPGVTSDEDAGDAWPDLRKKVLASDILLMGSPVWQGQPSRVCHRVLERMDAFLEEKDAEGRMVPYGKVACVAVVGNEGAHHVSAQLYQALNDVGFTLAANAVSYWVGEAKGSTDYKNPKKVPKRVVTATNLMVRNTVHLARLLTPHQYPGSA